MPIEYRVFSPFLTVVWVVVLLHLAAFVAMGPIMMGESVSVECSRAEGVCAVVKRYPLFGASRETQPLSQLGPPVLSSPVANGHAESFGFKAFYGAWMAADCVHAEDCQQAKSTFDAFFADPAMPSATAVLERPVAAPMIGMVTLLFTAILALIATVPLRMLRSAKISVDATTRKLLIERRRGFLPLDRRTFDVADVEGAVVRESIMWTALANRSSARLPNYTTVLTMRSGEDVPVLGKWSPSRAPHDRAAEAINAALQLTAGNASLRSG